MPIWLQNEARPHEKNSRNRHGQDRQRFCRICGKPVVSGSLCQICKLTYKQTERNNKK